MAEGKKSIIIYADWISLFEELNDEEAGQLVKHLFRYVNDQEPEAPNRLIKIAFEPIRQQLKRDLKHWEEVKEKRSISGKMGGRPKKEESNEKQEETKKANGFFEKQTKAKKAVTVNDNVTVNVNVKEEKKESITPEAKEENFKNSVFAFSGKYDEHMLQAFTNYWAEWNQKKTKMRFEMQTTFEISKRLATWAANQIKFDNRKETTSTPQWRNASAQEPQKRNWAKDSDFEYIPNPSISQQ